MAFLIYGMNNLDICSCGIGYAYLNAPCQEKMWTKSGSESGSDKGYLFLNLRDIYGPKSSGKAWRAKLAETLDSISYRHTESYPNVQKKRATEENGTAYYKYMLVYADYVLHLAKYAQEYMLNLNQVYQLKEGFGPTDRYIGSNVDKVQLEYGRTFWSMTCV